MVIFWGFLPCLNIKWRLGFWCWRIIHVGCNCWLIQRTRIFLRNILVRGRKESDDSTLKHTCQWRLLFSWFSNVFDCFWLFSTIAGQNTQHAGTKYIFKNIFLRKNKYSIFENCQIPDHDFLAKSQVLERNLIFLSFLLVFHQVLTDIQSSKTILLP